MKKTIRTILCAAAVVMASVSCQKSIEPANPAEEGKETIDICVSGLMGEYTQQDGVKSSLVNNVRVAWAAGDVVYVFDGSKYLGKLIAALDKKADGDTDEDRYAKLGGTISAPSTTPCVLSLVHSSLMTEPETGAAVSELSIDMRAQSTATVPFVAYATLKYTGTTITDVVVPFQFATSVIKVNCTGLWANTAITSATLDNVNTECKLTLSGSAAPTVSGDANGTITRTGDAYFAASKVNSEGEAVFQIAVPALAASSARFLTVSHGSYKFNDRKFTTSSLNPATSVNTVCQLVGPPVGSLPGVFSVGPNATDKVYFSKGNLYAKNEGTTESPDWKWHFYDKQYNFLAANMDVSGSTDFPQRTVDENETEIDLFTWGYSQATSLLPAGDAYVIAHTNLDQLVYYKASSKGGDDWGVAYCESNNIRVGTWRTLTTEEWQYLFNNHSTKWATVNGVGGYVIAPDNVTLQAEKTSYTATELNDANLVFLPAAGNRSGSSNVFNVGSTGYYWSSTACGSDDAGSVIISSSSVDPFGMRSRILGCSVRLITESK